MKFLPTLNLTSKVFKFLGTTDVRRLNFCKYSMYKEDIQETSVNKNRISLSMKIIFLFFRL